MDQRLKMHRLSLLFDPTLAQKPDAPRPRETGYFVDRSPTWRGTPGVPERATRRACPPTGQVELSAEQLESIRKWIADGGPAPTPAAP